VRRDVCPDIEKTPVYNIGKMNDWFWKCHDFVNEIQLGLLLFVHTSKLFNANFERKAKELRL